MSTAKSGVLSNPPTVSIKKKAPENPFEEIYTRAYATKEYREYSPGYRHAGRFFEVAGPIKTQTVIDWGCGTGRGGHELWKRGLNVRLVDFVPPNVALDEEIYRDVKENDDLNFIRLDMTKPISEEVIGPPAQFGFCVDVLEHIPEEDISQTLDNILSHSRQVYFQICVVEDHFGSHPEIKGDSEEDLHLHVTVKPYSWWLNKFAEKGCLIHRSQDRSMWVAFYVTKERGLVLDSQMGRINTSKAKRIANAKHSASLGLPSLQPHPAQDKEIMLLAGGPSLNDFKDEIIEQREAGIPLVTVNGAYCWARENGLKPSMQFLVDSRDFNKRFVEQDFFTKETKYVVTSVADPSVFESLPLDRTYISHVTQENEVMDEIIAAYGELYNPVFPVPGGCTVTLRAICALRMLGFYKIRLYGFDSCVITDDDVPEKKDAIVHHAYEQTENDCDVDNLLSWTIAQGSEYERTFYCVPWMAFQLNDFQQMIRNGLLEDIQLDIKGDGLIAYWVKTAAALGGNLEIGSEKEEKPEGRFYVVNRKM